MDITQSIQKAINSNTNWKHSDFGSAVDALSLNYHVDIEINAEKIGVLSSEEKIIAYVHLNYPIILLENNYSQQIKSILSSYKIQYIMVNTLDDQCLSVDPDIYNTYFDYMRHLDNFSADDFYFYNVT